jgi:ComF family protein
MFNSFVKYFSLIKLDLKPILHLFFPFRCHGCGLELLAEESGVCVFCESGLEYTFNQIELPTHLVDESVKIHALFYYRKGQVAQALLHALKYEHERDLCLDWGVTLAKTLKKETIQMPECLIPVPLHPKKKFVRGYNQSELLAKGIQAEFPEIQVDLDLIVRKKNNKSQTSKNKYNRLSDVSNAFELHPNAASNYKHIGLVDDVVTTGATLKGLLDLIQSNHPHIRITIFVLAVTK